MESLRELGLTKYETAAYTVLLQHGKKDAKSISKLSAIPQTAVYPTLKELIRKGLVQKMGDNTIIFEALNPEITIPTLTTERINTLKATQDEVLSEIAKLPLLEEKTEELIEVSRGEESSHQILRKLSAITEKNLYIMGWQFRTNKNIYRISKVLRELLSSGKDVRIIAHPSAAGTDKWHEFTKLGIPIRFSSIKNVSIIIRDGKECKITLKKDTLVQKVNLHIQDRDLGKAMEEYFMTVWKKSSTSSF